MGHCFSAHSTTAAQGEKWKSPKKASADSSYLKNSSSSTAKHNARKSSMSRRCMSLVKEQRARLYIIRRCVTMLLCWHKYGDV